MKANHPEEPHWYLAVLGGDPLVRGVGSAMRCCGHASSDAMPNTRRPILSRATRSTFRYERFGPEVTGELVLPDGTLAGPCGEGHSSNPVAKATLTLYSSSRRLRRSFSCLTAVRWISSSAAASGASSMASAMMIIEFTKRAGQDAEIFGAPRSGRETSQVANSEAIKRISVRIA